MTKRISLLVAAAWAVSLVALAAAGCAAPAQKTDVKEPQPTDYTVMTPAMRLLTIEAQGPAAPGAKEALTKLLTDKSRIYQAQAAQTLACWAATGDAAIVIPALASKDPLVRGVAQAAYIQANAYNLAPLVIGGHVVDVPAPVLAALADFRDPSGLVNLDAIFDSQRDALRKQLEGSAEDAVLVADILARDGDAGARRVLINLGHATDGIILGKAARASVRDEMLLGSTLLPLAFKNDEFARRAVMMALVACPDPQLKALPIRGLHDADPSVRRNAIRALGNLGAAAPVDLMAAELAKLSAANDPAYAFEKGELIRSLGVVGKPAAGALRDYLKKNATSDDMLQVTALLAFGPSGAPEDVSWIAKRLESPNKLIRAAAATALGKIAHPAAQAALISVVKDPDPLVRASIAKALGQISTAYASLELVRMLDDPSDLVSSMAAWGLGTAAYEDAIPALENIARTRVSQDPLPPSFGEVYGWPDLAAVDALGRIHSTASAALLREQLKSPSWAMRATAAHALGATGDASAPTIAALESALKDPVSLVKAEALISLRTLGKAYTPDQLIILSSKVAAK
jgi:HEAT repeat protein